MATTYVFDRGSCYGEAEFLGNLDPNGEYTEEQLELVRVLFVEKVSALVESYDPSLTWLPSLSEVWGVVGKTEADPIEFRDWWTSGANGAFETALMDSYMAVATTDELAAAAREIINAGNYDAAVSLMDDELREAVHADLSPCSEEEFLTEYMVRHQAKHGEEFTV